MTRFRTVLGTSVAALALVGSGLLSGPVAQAAPTASNPDLGPHTLIFDPSMPTAVIQAKVDAVAAQMVDNEMGSDRWALLFKPGAYGTPEAPLNIQVGYYTEVAGLGASPADVVINGKVEVHNRCFSDGCYALNNFWRTASNLTVKVAGGEGCYSSANFWAASQASPLRRVDVQGANLSLMDYCSAGPQYASGGFIADSRAGTIINGSQQQYFTRNSSVGTWTNAVWNQVFAGVEGAPAQRFPDPPYTTLATAPATREKPYLFVDASGTWQVWVPSAASGTSGPTWTGGQTPGRAVPLSAFHIVRPGESARAIGDAVGSGKNLLFTPGVYSVDKTINVKRPDTIVLGLGMPSLTSAGGAIVMKTDSVPGIELAGLTFDAGPTQAPVLLQVGKPNAPKPVSAASDPTLLSDVFVRVGGPHVGKAVTSIEVNADHVLMDDVWVWRADHGSGVGWTVNTGRNGLVVNGSDVAATGLFVEHFQQYNVVWNGERGNTVFFQNELPYDPPSQAAYQHDGKLGWAAYKVADTVKTHQLWGAGAYIYTNVVPTIHVTDAFEVPVTPGVQLHDLVTVSLNHAGTIDHIVNGVGGAATPDHSGQTQTLVSYGG